MDNINYFNTIKKDDIIIYNNNYYNSNISRFSNSFFIVNNNKRYIKTSNNKVIIPRILLQEGTKPNTNTPFKIVDSFKNIFIWTEHYGDKNICHWFHEQLNGIVYLSKLYSLNPDIKIIVNKNAPLKNNIKDILYFIPNFKKESIYEFDISNDCIAIQSENIYLNNGSFDYSLNLPCKIFKFLLDELNVAINSSKIDNIYISRRKTNTNSRKLENINEISDYILTKGYVEIFMEDLSLNEKIDLIYNSKNIIMEIGAGCINLCFCNPNVNILLLTQKTNEMAIFFNNMFYPVIQDKKYSIVYGSTLKDTNMKGVNTPWVLDINTLKEVLH